LDCIKGSIFGLGSLLDDASDWILEKVPAYFVPKIVIMYLLSVKNGSSLVYRYVLRRLLSLKVPSVSSIQFRNPFKRKQITGEPSQETLLNDEGKDINENSESIEATYHLEQLNSDATTIVEITTAVKDDDNDISREETSEWMEEVNQGMKEIQEERLDLESEQHKDAEIVKKVAMQNMPPLTPELLKDTLMEDNAAVVA
jgi:hypothetical protein